MKMKYFVLLFIFVAEIEPSSGSQRILSLNAKMFCLVSSI